MKKSFAGIAPAALLAAALLTWVPASAQAGTLWAADGRAGKAALLYRIDPASGRPTVVGPLVDGNGTPYVISSLALASDGTLYAASNGRWGSDDIAELFTVDKATGELTLVGPLDDGGGNQLESPRALAFNGSGTLYLTTANSNPSTYNNDLFSVDLTTNPGRITSLGDTGGHCGNGMVWDAANTRMLFSNNCNNGDLEVINLTDATQTQACDTLDGDGNGSLSSMTFMGTTLLGVQHDFNDGPSQLVRIDPTACTITVLGILPSMVEAIVYEN